MKHFMAIFTAIALISGAFGALPELSGVFGNVKTVGVAAISSKVPIRNFIAVTNRLGRAGYKMKVMPNVTEPVVASAERRARLLEKLWMDPEVDIVVFAYGGQGAIDVAPLLDWERLRKRDMPVIGFSDLTVLVNMMLGKKAGHPYTGPVLTTLGYSNAAAVRRMKNMMAGRPEPVKLTAVKSGAKAVSGLAMGGLLDRLHRMTLKGWLPDAKGRVIFIENTNKYAARTDEMLGDMCRKGVFNNAAAVVFCDFNSKAPKAQTRAKLKKFAESIPCPVYTGYPYGHISNTSIIDFRRQLTITPDGTLTWQSGDK